MTVSRLILYFVFFTLFSRVMSNFGFPSFINFLHFPLILVLAIIVLPKNKNISVRKFIYSLFFFVIAVSASAIINEVGFINVILEVLLLIEPFLLVFCIFSLKWSENSIKKFRSGLLIIVFIHLFFVFFQFLILGYTDDYVVGLMFNLGAGAHISGAISLSFAIYWYSYKNIKSTHTLNSELSSFAFIILLVLAVIFSDAKQIFAVFLLALAVLSLINTSDIKKTLRIVFTFLVCSIFLYEISQTIFPALQTWAKFDLLEEGLIQKLSVFSLISDSYTSFFNYVLGLGSGHTVGRLAMLLPDYQSLLSSFGATTFQLTSDVWIVHQGHYMSNSITGSSMFSLFFSWAGIWGDLGFLGLSIYLYMYYIIWKIMLTDTFSKFILITVFILGWVFQWLEEPQYMLFIMSLIGLRWQEIELSKGSVLR